MDFRTGTSRQFFTILLFLAVLAGGAELVGLREHFSVTLLQQKLAEHRTSGLMLFVLLFSLGNLIQIPGWIFLAAAVFALGRTTGGIVTYVAAISSCTVTFLTVRAIGGNALRGLNSRIARTLLGRLDASPVKNIAVLRMLFQTLPALNYALALSGVGFRRYLVGTLLGLPLPIAVYCLFFDSLASLAHEL